MDIIIRCDFQSKRNGKVDIEESSTLSIISGDDLDDGIVEAALEADSIASRYNCKMKRWGKHSWRIWEPGEDGFDIWIRITEG